MLVKLWSDRSPDAETSKAVMVSAASSRGVGALASESVL